ncbi:MAG: isoprenylcysteine carboxylmethyltransferase family protein [Thermaerobacter sp.]|nr:isoprenylcysteine carboxylmethyltransferase family protein [Thermaerobacter sp.]
MRTLARSEGTPWYFRHRVPLFMALYVGSGWVGGGPPVWRLAAAALSGSGGDGAWARGLWAGAGLLMVAGGALRCWGVAYLPRGVPVDSAVRTDSLRVAGPYRHVRNPLYLGLLVISIGFAVLDRPVGALVLVAGSAALAIFLIRSEEAAMQRRWGSSYAEYCRRVGALWPRCRAATGGAAPAAWAAALGEEFYFPLVGLFFLTTAVFPSLGGYSPGLVLLLPVWLLAHRAGAGSREAS